MDLKQKDFESALKELEEIVKELEKGDLTLEQSLAGYENGVRLARFCNAKLEEAEKRIEMLRIDDQGEPRRDATGAVIQTPLELEEEER
jgi:exodeoxyribonuclease VII small subunit